MKTSICIIVCPKTNKIVAFSISNVKIYLTVHLSMLECIMLIWHDGYKGITSAICYNKCTVQSGYAIPRKHAVFLRLALNSNVNFGIREVIR